MVKGKQNQATCKSLLHTIRRWQMHRLHLPDPGRRQAGDKRVVHLQEHEGLVVLHGFDAWGDSGQSL